MPSILLIDDDSSLLRVTEYNLSKAGFTVLAASSGSEGLTLFEQMKPDVVVKMYSWVIWMALTF